MIDGGDTATSNSEGLQAPSDVGQPSLEQPLTATDFSQNISWCNGASHGEGPFDVDLAWTFDYVITHMDDTLHDVSSQSIPRTYSVAVEGHTVNSTSTNETHSEWPDGQSRSVSPLRGQHTPSFSDSRFVDMNEIDGMIHGYHAVFSRPCKLSSETTSILYELVTSEQLVGFCGQQPSPGEFPDTCVLQHFLLLYFVHVHPRFPVAHLPTFSTDRCPPDLLFSMILAGSCHSDSNQYTFCHAYIERARTSATLQRERGVSHVSTFVKITYESLIERLAENTRPHLHTVSLVFYCNMVWTNGTISSRRDRSRSSHICMQEDSFAGLSLREAV